MNGVRGRRFITVALLLAVLGISGCASTQLIVNLDIYKEDPSSIAPLSVSRVASLYQSLTSAVREVEGLTMDREKLADDVFATYEAYAKLNTAVRGGSWDPSALSALRQQLAAHKEALRKRLEQAKSLLGTARAKLDSYVKVVPAAVGTQSSAALPAQIEAINAVREAHRAIVELSGTPNTDFQTGLVENWAVVAESLTKGQFPALLKQNAAAAKDAVDNLRTQVSTLAATIKRIAENSGRISSEFSTRLLEAANGLNVAQPSQFTASVVAIAREATEIPKSIKLGDMGRTAIGDLAQSTSFLNSQIDRLQNPADPVWRTVTTQENETKWNTTFSQTYFYSEGNNSVVVVRDTPMSFRVQQGNNNPAALIESQLQISRAIASGAISISGALLGVQLPQGAGPVVPPAQAKDGAQPEDSLVAKAKAERQAQIRATALSGLRSRLALLRNDFAALPADNSDAARLKELLRRLNATLKGYQPLFTIAN